MTAAHDLNAGRRCMLVLVASDLLLGSRVRGIAEHAGYSVATVPNLNRRLAEVVRDDQPRIVVDLVTPGVDAACLTEWLGPALDRTLAYAPHVRVDLLKAARSAGIGTVLVRSQLEAELPRWLDG